MQNIELAQRAKYQETFNMLRYAVYDDGLHIWIDGKLIGIIPPHDFPYLLTDMMKHIQEHVQWHHK